jgi:DNA-binding response OmpR family regulator
MHEYGAAASRNARAGVVIDLDDEVVEAVIAPQSIAWFIGRADEGPIVPAIDGIIAPCEPWGDAARRQQGPRPQEAVGPPPQAEQAKAAARGPAVAFSLVGADARSPQDDRHGERSRQQHAAGAIARPGAHPDQWKRQVSHRLSTRKGVAGRCPGGKRRLLFYPRMFYFGHRSPAGDFRGTGRMSNVRNILIVDDDAELRDALVEQLGLHEEFDAVAVDTGSKGVQAAKAGQIDLVIMDVSLPDIDGREAVRILRKNGFKAPIIMLTGHNTDSDTILGLESGANDYVAKPFRFAVLLARIRAQLRQHEASEDAVFSIGPYTFRPSSKLLLNTKGNKVRLTEKETAILRFLYRAGQRPVSRETLLQEVWGYNSGVTTHTLETHIYRLRQKVERDAASPAILVTEAGGYKLVP